MVGVVVANRWLVVIAPITTMASSMTDTISSADALPTPVAPIIITATDLRKSPGQFLDRVFYRDESFVVERAGKPMAIIGPVNREMEQPATTQSNTDLGNLQSTHAFPG